QRHHRGRGVGVVGRGDDHGVEALLLLEHLAEVVVGFGPAVRCGGPLEGPGVDVAECRDVLTRDRLQVRGAAAADPDEADIQLLTLVRPGGQDPAAGNPEPGPETGRPAEELAAIRLVPGTHGEALLVFGHTRLSVTASLRLVRGSRTGRNSWA